MHVYLNYNTRARKYNITKYHKYLLKKYLYKYAYSTRNNTFDEKRYNLVILWMNLRRMDAILISLR